MSSLWFSLFETAAEGLVIPSDDLSSPAERAVTAVVEQQRLTVTKLVTQLGLVPSFVPIAKTLNHFGQSYAGRDFRFLRESLSLLFDGLAFHEDVTNSSVKIAATDILHALEDYHVRSTKPVRFSF